MKTGIPSLNIPKTDPMDIDKYAHLPFDKHGHDPYFSTTLPSNDHNITMIIDSKSYENTIDHFEKILIYDALAYLLNSDNTVRQILQSDI